MSDHTLLRFQTELSKEEMLDQLRSKLSEFSWRGGDSDQQGPYISGRNPDSIKVKIWLGEFPYEASISFITAWTNSNNRDQKKEGFINIFKEFLRDFSVLS